MMRDARRCTGGVAVDGMIRLRRSPRVKYNECRVEAEASE
jgi:hypothetical protein